MKASGLASSSSSPRCGNAMQERRRLVGAEVEHPHDRRPALEPGQDRLKRGGVLGCSLGHAGGIEERELGAQQSDSLRAGAEPDLELVAARDVGQHGDPRVPSVVTAGCSRSSPGARRRASRRPRMASSAARALGRRMARRSAAGRAVEHHSRAVGDLEDCRTSPVTIGIPSERATIAACAVGSTARQRDPGQRRRELGDIAGSEIVRRSESVALPGRRRPAAPPAERQPGRPAPEAAHVVGARRQQLVADAGDRVGVARRGGRRIASAAGRPSRSDRVARRARAAPDPGHQRAGLDDLRLVLGEDRRRAALERARPRRSAASAVLALGSRALGRHELAVCRARSDRPPGGAERDARRRRRARAGFARASARPATRSALTQRGEDDRGRGGAGILVADRPLAEIRRAALASLHRHGRLGARCAPRRRPPATASRERSRRGRARRAAPPRPATARRPSSCRPGPRRRARRRPRSRRRGAARAARRRTSRRRRAHGRRAAAPIPTAGRSRHRPSRRASCRRGSGAGRAGSRRPARPAPCRRRRSRGACWCRDHRRRSRRRAGSGSRSGP